MDISVFEVIGTVMVGPSSSHTAGAAKLARVAQKIASKKIKHVRFGLHGSFAKTYKGHATDKALVAGILGFAEYDSRLASSFELAKKAGITFEFYEIELKEMHQNSVKIDMTLEDETTCSVIGSSIGGGRIEVRNINGFEMKVNLNVPTIVITHYDKKGVISDVTRLLSDEDLNIGTMMLSRKNRGQKAFCVIEMDDPIPETIASSLKQTTNVIDAIVINV